VGGAEPPRAHVVVNVANALSALRLVLAPVLLLLAWRGQSVAFTWTLAASLLTDLLDGQVARRFGQETKLGAVLDSVGDLATYGVVPVCAVWLVPGLIAREPVAFWLTAWSYLFPVVVALVRFRRMASYHTYSAKVGAVLMGGAGLALFAWGTTLPWRIVLPVLVLSAVENLAITAVLPTWRPNVPTVWHALSARRAAHMAADGVA
jgi:CDP-diacylglycerol---glycerol-3-phosphate 3-phosphatidyltransferase